MANSLADDLLIILAMGFLAALVCRRLRVSLIVGYLLAGIVVGKGGFHWVHDARHELEMIAEMGVFFLLCSIGLEFSLDDLWRLGRNLLIGGSLQMLLVALLTGSVLLQAGLPREAALLIAGAVSFSSTVLVFKALSEQGQSSLPHGRRAIGILFQDAALVPVLLIVPLLTQSGLEPQVLGWIVFGGVLLAIGGHFLVLGAVQLAEQWGIDRLVIGLTVVAIGSSTPELVTSLVTGLRKQGDIAVGNILGSNIANLLLVGGAAGMLSPVPIEVELLALTRDIPLMIGVAVLCLPICWSGFRIQRWEGALLVGGFLIYLGVLLVGPS